MSWRAAFRALAGFARLHRSRFGEWQIELVSFVLRVPAPGAFDAQPDDYGDVIVHARQRDAAHRSRRQRVSVANR